MASYSCTIVLALDIARRLSLANVPFTLEAQSSQSCTVTCKFDDTLQCVVDQLNGRHIPISRGDYLDLISVETM